MTFAACFPVIIESEGGLANLPGDSGGVTNLGVTQATLSAWLRRPATIDEVKALTVVTVAPLYEQNFYLEAHCDELAAGLDLMVFDAAVNSGPSRAIKLLQEAVGVSADGQFGPQTRAAVEARSTTDMIEAFHSVHIAFYQSLRDTPAGRYLPGWLARNDRTRDIALKMVQGSAT